MRVIRRFWAACCLTVILTLNTSAPYAQDVDEYDVKASFIYNFTKFVEWPGALAVNKQSSIDICLIGDSDILNKAAFFKDRASTPQLKISLVREKSPENAGHCHIVFIGDSEARQMKEILAHFKGKPLLTVSDIEEFAERGGMVGFTLVDDKVKLVMNPKAAAASGLRIDAQLLEIAVKVVDR